MRRISFFLSLVLMLTLTTVGCKTKDPVQPADTSMRTTSIDPGAEEITPTPAPSTDRDPRPLEDPDLANVNNYVRQNGLLGDVYFDFDQYDLRQEARDRLAKNAAFLRENTGFQVRIEGHCDERGTNEYNLALGERRSNASKAYLSSLGVDGSRVQVISYGEEKPSCAQNSEGCWAQNRRAHFVITGRR